MSLVVNKKLEDWEKSKAPISRPVSWLTGVTLSADTIAAATSRAKKNLARDVARAQQEVYDLAHEGEIKFFLLICPLGAVAATISAVVAGWSYEQLGKVLIPACLIVAISLWAGLWKIRFGPKKA